MLTFLYTGKILMGAVRSALASIIREGLSTAENHGQRREPRKTRERGLVIVDGACKKHFPKR